jgi:hypothetical protein
MLSWLTQAVRRAGGWHPCQGKAASSSLGGLGTLQMPWQLAGANLNWWRRCPVSGPSVWFNGTSVYSLHIVSIPPRACHAASFPLKIIINHAAGHAMDVKNASADDVPCCSGRSSRSCPNLMSLNPGKDYRLDGPLPPYPSTVTASVIAVVAAQARQRRRGKKCSFLASISLHNKQHANDAKHRIPYSSHHGGQYCRRDKCTCRIARLVLCVSQYYGVIRLLQHLVPKSSRESLQSGHPPAATTFRPARRADTVTCHMGCTLE